MNGIVLKLCNYFILILRLYILLVQFRVCIMYFIFDGERNFCVLKHAPEIPVGIIYYVLE